MCNVKCGGRFEVNFLAGTGVVGRTALCCCLLSDAVAMSMSEAAFRLFSLMTSPAALPVTVGETALAKLQLDMLIKFVHLLCLLLLLFWLMVLLL